MGSRIQVLSTALLTPSLVERAADSNMDLDVLPFTAIKELDANILSEQIVPLFQKQLTVVFTSVNAVNAVTRFKGNTNPAWKIYCTGIATKRLVSELFGAETITGTANNAADIAALIIREGARDVVFFCGNIRRNELPEKLAGAGIKVKEIMVYDTVAIDHKLHKDYDAILFFSPAAVNSFFCSNTVAANTILFAIGQTTTAEIRLHTLNQVVVSNEPDKAGMLDLVIKKYQDQPISQ